MTKQKHFYLIRGLIREKGHWGAFLDELHHAYPKARITAIDIPGAGDYFQEESPLSITRMVELMRQDYLRSKNENEEAYLIAISLGGMISLEWLRHHPDDFKQAVFINTSFGGISPVHQRLLPGALCYLFKVPLLKGREKEAHILKLVSNHQEVFNSTLDLWDEIQQKRPVSIKNTIRQLLAAARFNGRNFTPPLPILLLGSTSDRMVSINCSRAIQERWNLPLKEHPTAGHDLTADDPAWVKNQILEFIP